MDKQRIQKLKDLAEILDAKSQGNEAFLLAKKIGKLEDEIIKLKQALTITDELASKLELDSLTRTLSDTYDSFNTKIKQILAEHRKIAKDKDYSDDYFSKEINSIKKLVSELKLQKGQDGRDGKDGKDGSDYLLTDNDKQEIASLVEIPDTTQATAQKVLETIEIPEETGKSIVEKLELLKGNERLDASAIKNLPIGGDKYYGGAGIKGLRAGTNIAIDNSNIAYPTISSTASGGTWGSITGTLSNQTDLQTALDAKLNLDQTTPQTFTNLGGGTGLMKVTAGLLGLDTNTYLTSEADTLGTVTSREATTAYMLQDLQRLTWSNYFNTNNVYAQGFYLGRIYFESDVVGGGGNLKLYYASGSWRIADTLGETTDCFNADSPSALPGNYTGAGAFTGASVTVAVYDYNPAPSTPALSTVLAQGNTTSGNDISFSQDGDVITDATLTSIDPFNRKLYALDGVGGIAETFNWSVSGNFGGAPTIGVRSSQFFDGSSPTPFGTLDPVNRILAGEAGEPVVYWFGDSTSVTGGLKLYQGLYNWNDNTWTLDSNNRVAKGVADSWTLENQPTGGTALAIATTDYVDTAVTTNKTLQFFGDLTGMYAAGVTRWKLVDMDRGSATFPSGITITSIYVDCSAADPTTELNGNIKYCDALANGAFPGANPTLVNAIDTTTGNFSITDMSTSSLGSGSIPAGKILYFDLDADPTDTSQTWSIIVNYTIN